MGEKVTGIFLASLLIISGCSVHQEMAELPLKQPTLAIIEDGGYPGYFENYRWFCMVEVEIRSHSYDTIRVLSSANGGKAFYEKLVSRVLEQQSIELDALSGATLTSKTFLKAVEKALEQ